MRPQTTLRAFEWTLLAAILGTHLVARWFVLRLGPDNDYGGKAMLEGLLVAQVALLVGWGILGPGLWFIRLPLASGLLWMIFSLGVYARREGPLVDLLVFDDRSPETLLRHWLLLGEMILLAVLFVGLRLWGTRIERQPWAVNPWGDSFRPRWSLRSLIVATAIGAVLVRASMLVRAYWLADSASHAPIAGTILAVLTSAMMLLCMWTTLRRIDAFYRLMFVAPICGVLAYLILTPLHAAYGELLLPIASLLGYEAVVLVITLLLVRIAGFRLIRPVAAAKQSDPTPATINYQSPQTDSSHAMQVSL